MTKLPRIYVGLTYPQVGSLIDKFTSAVNGDYLRLGIELHDAGLSFAETPERARAGWLRASFGEALLNAGGRHAEPHRS